MPCPSAELGGSTRETTQPGSGLQPSAPDAGSPGIRNYDLWHRLWDRLLRGLASNGWPGRLAVRLGASVEVEIEEHTVDVPVPLGTGSALRIAFAADFHVGPTTPPALLDNALAALRRAQGDVLLLGGDFVGVRAEATRELAHRLADIPAPLGRFAVLGNHDHWVGVSGVIRCLTDAGIEVLINRQVRLPPPFEQVSICGLDDHASGAPDAETAFRGAAPVRVLLMHAPSGLLDVGDREFAVGLSGHTHGGQIALPSGRPLVTAGGPLSRRYNAGSFPLGRGRTLLVSRGVGFTLLPVRLNAPASVLVCELRGPLASS